MRATLGNRCRLSLLFVALSAGLAVVMSACGPPSVGFTFENRTDSALCEYLSDADTRGADCLDEIDPNSKKGSGRDCDGQRNRSFTVILTVKEDGREIFRTTGTCGEWDETKRRFVIDREGDEFIVTDSLPNP
jgi:hypothetical protein